MSATMFSPVTSVVVLPDRVKPIYCSPVKESENKFIP
jgi:hypothetical protein